MTILYFFHKFFLMEHNKCKIKKDENGRKVSDIMVKVICIRGLTGALIPVGNTSYLFCILINIGDIKFYSCEFHLEKHREKENQTTLHYIF